MNRRACWHWSHCRRTCLQLFVLIAALAVSGVSVATGRTAAPVVAGNANRSVTMSDAGGNLVLHLNADGRCLLDHVIVRGREVVAPETGVCSAIQVSGKWFTTRSGIAQPKVLVGHRKVVVSDIVYGGGGIQVRETWTFTVNQDRIDWRIDRNYVSGGRLDDTYFPGWDFQDMATWTGAMLDNGGVAWNKYLETPNATYGAHAGSLTLWNRERNDCLRIELLNQTFRPDERRGALKGAGEISGVTTRTTATTGPLQHVTTRFSHQPSGIEAVAFSVSEEERQPKHDLCRYLRSRQDLWAPFEVRPGRISVTCRLQALDYAKASDRGTINGLNGSSIRELLNTIGRYGVIDRRLVGANGWRTGFICLHEQWFSQMGIALDDADYLANCAASYDWERDHAIDQSGRVKSRWCYGPGDAIPGSYDSQGYYEAQWGYLLDSQPCYVMCVAELFDLTGDLKWLRAQKAACENALDYLLRRDSDGDGLVEMMTDSHTQERGSDWVDIIWASHENALVNAELYYALSLWADAEDLLGANDRATEYRQHAAKLKTAYNKTCAEGGFWDPRNQWYVYWRDKDGSIHGNNLVTPVNFAAIGYGLCDDGQRRGAILKRMEDEMQKENLFFWPLSFFPYESGEGRASNYPFPKYENGDIFLSWGELAIRAYAKSDPAIALKYIRNVLEKYETDGLSYQRYQRKSQSGSGADILAGNCMPVVGLYRDVYGIQPKYNRLYLEPHLTTELSGTQVRYQLRNQQLTIDLNVGLSRMTVDQFSVTCPEPFGLNVKGETAQFFPGSRSTFGLSVTRPRRVPMEITVEAWPTSQEGARRWVESCSSRGMAVRHVISDLEPNAMYVVRCDGQKTASLRADAGGKIGFERKIRSTGPQRLEVVPESRKQSAELIPGLQCPQGPSR